MRMQTGIISCAGAQIDEICAVRRYSHGSEKEDRDTIDLYFFLSFSLLKSTVDSAVARFKKETK